MLTDIVLFEYHCLVMLSLSVRWTQLLWGNRLSLVDRRKPIPIKYWQKIFLANSKIECSVDGICDDLFRSLD